MESPEQLGRMAVRLKLENRQHYKDNSMKIATGGEHGKG